MYLRDAGDLELERRFESFAHVRLSPDPEAAARLRARILREARFQFEATAIAGHVAPTLTAAAQRSVTRRLAMPFLAATVWLAIGLGSISAAQAGGPLYSTRLWIENAGLPAAAAPRAVVELARLEARLAEAFAAAARGDAGAVEAALAAYDQITAEVVAAGRDDKALEDLVAAALDRHRVVLTAVADRLGEQNNSSAARAVRASIERTIAHNQAVAENIQAAPPGSGSTGSGGSGGSAGTGPAAQDPTQGPAGGDAQPTDSGDKPARTTQPTVPPAPARTVPARPPTPSRDPKPTAAPRSSEAPKARWTPAAPEPPREQNQPVRPENDD